MEVIVGQLADLEALAKQVLDFAGSRKIWLFSGEIGAGKTTFIQAIGRHLGINEQATSPTFSLINEYTYLDSDQQKMAFLYHMDLYRLEHLQEAIDIGIEDYLDNQNYCFIEWPALIEAILPDDCLKINIEILENSNRKIIFL